MQKIKSVILWVKFEEANYNFRLSCSEEFRREREKVEREKKILLIKNSFDNFIPFTYIEINPIHLNPD